MSADQYPDRLIFAGCLALAVVSAVVTWVLRQIDKATTYPAVTS